MPCQVGASSRARSVWMSLRSDPDHPGLQALAAEIRVNDRPINGGSLALPLSPFRTIVASGPAAQNLDWPHARRPTFRSRPPGHGVARAHLASHPVLIVDGASTIAVFDRLAPNPSRKDRDLLAIRQAGTGPSGRPLPAGRQQPRSPAATRHSTLRQVVRQQASVDNVQNALILFCKFAGNRWPPDAGNTFQPVTRSSCAFEEG